MLVTQITKHLTPAKETTTNMHCQFNEQISSHNTTQNCTSKATDNKITTLSRLCHLL